MDKWIDTSQKKKCKHDPEGRNLNIISCLFTANQSHNKIPYHPVRIVLEKGALKNYKFSWVCSGKETQKLLIRLWSHEVTMENNIEIP